MQKTESNKMDMNAFLGRFSRINSIPFNANETGAIMAARYNNLVEIFSLPKAIKYKPETISNTKMIRKKIFIRSNFSFISDKLCQKESLL